MVPKVGKAGSGRQAAPNSSSTTSTATRATISRALVWRPELAMFASLLVLQRVLACFEGPTEACHDAIDQAEADDQHASDGPIRQGTQHEAEHRDRQADSEHQRPDARAG